MSENAPRAEKKKTAISRLVLSDFFRFAAARGSVPAMASQADAVFRCVRVPGRGRALMATRPLDAGTVNGMATCTPPAVDCVLIPGYPLLFAADGADGGAAGQLAVRLEHAVRVPRVQALHAATGDGARERPVKTSWQRRRKKRKKGNGAS